MGRPAIEYVKCSICGWVHFLVDDDGINNCFLCSIPAREMVEAKESDFPIGCTIQGINRYAYEWRPQEE